MPEILPTNDEYLESPVSDGTIEENFEAELGSNASSGLGDEGSNSVKDDNDFSDIANQGVVDIIGDDSCGRKVIVVSACRLPSNKVFNHDKFLRLEFFYKL